MRSDKYLRLRTDRGFPVLVGLLWLAWTLVIYGCLTSVASGRRIGLLKLLIMTLTSQHQELFFLLPCSIGGWLLFFQPPTALELPYLVNARRLRPLLGQYIWRWLTLYLISICSACVVLGLFNPRVTWDGHDWGLALILLLGHWMGSVICWLTLGLLTILWRRTLAVLVWVLLILADQWLFGRWGWSVFLTNGLTLGSRQYGVNLFTNLCLYGAYIGLLISALRPAMMRQGRRLP
ncbi:hypothetical protein [Lacticaseibacillus absianus]|uniref:hypothetical protein n=1 Tax=Lacticaseibacillus absianus TaxID=2729623 RepID=UPI0015CCC408|nr:hypothetical protein [Lacticaseibacillus absianus]